VNSVSVVGMAFARVGVMGWIMAVVHNLVGRCCGIWRESVMIGLAMW
jgi:hypothetical protein